MFEKGSAPAEALVGETNPPVDLSSMTRLILGVPMERVEAEAETYRSYADRQFDMRMQDVLPAATVKWLEQERDKYDAWEKQQVTQAVAGEVEEHCATADNLRIAARDLAKELTGLSDSIKARSLTTAQALSKLDAIQQAAAQLRRQRDGLAANTKLSEFKLAHPHRYMDHMHQSFQSLPRKPVFDR